MSTYVTLFGLLSEVLNSHGFKTRLDHGSQENLVINLESPNFLAMRIYEFDICLDDRVAEMIVNAIFIDCRESVLSQTLIQFLRSNSNRAVRLLPHHLVEYDCMFWHFSNGNTGLSAEQRARFANWADKNHIRFIIGSSAEMTGAQLVASRPDVGFIHYVCLMIALSLLELCERLWADHRCFDTFLNWKTQVGGLMDLFGVLIDEFRWSLPTIKGLSKSCGEWALESNRASLFTLCNLLDKVATSTKAAYTVAPEVAETWIGSRRTLALDYLRYLRQYASICLVILSLSYWAVVSDDDTPEERIEASIPVVARLGRIVHALFDDIRNKVRADYVGDN